TNNVNTASDGNNTNNINAVSSTVNAADIKVNADGAKTSIELPDDPNMPELEDIVYSGDAEDVGTEADMNNLNTFIPVSPIPTTRIHKDHPVEQIIRDLNSTPQTRRMTKNLKEHEERIDYDEVFAPIARIEAIRLLLAYASFKDFVVYQMDVKSAFLYGKIEEEVYVCQPLGFEDPDFSDRKLVCTEFEKMMDKKFQMSSMGELTFFLGLQVKQKEDGIFISQDKYMTEILKKFGFFDVKTVSTSMETQKPLLKDEDGEEVDVHLYRSIIGSLMYLTSSRPDIIYLKSQPKLGLWNLKDSPFDLVAYTDSDYARASLDRKSTIGAASSCRGQVLWIQNQLLDYGLKKRVKKLKKKGGPRTHKLKRLYSVGRSARVVSSEEASLGDQEDASKQGRKIDDIDKDAEITLVDETQGRYGDEDVFGVNDLDGDEVSVESEVTDKAGEKRNVVEEAVVVTDDVTIPVSAATITNVELTLAQTPAELKSARPKTKGSKDKGKAKMIEPEKTLKKKDQIKFDEDEALRLQAKFDEKDRHAREKAQQVEEANIA
ncbi:putative ribonuclease H-like domain-containing protein, partial [Tanacetum coccineum]